MSGSVAQERARPEQRRAQRERSRKPRRVPAHEVASTERLRALGREALDEGRALVATTRALLRESDRLAREHLDAAPLATLTLAVGLGVFLGGGLPFGAVRLAGRAAAGMLVDRVVAATLPLAAPARR